jgi:hypothetical protein
LADLCCLLDTIAFFNINKNGKHNATLKMEDVAFTKSRTPFQRGTTFADAFYSFGINFPGAITHNNYPEFLRRLPDPADPALTRDMGTVDILRDRERGVPRYNAFRRMLRLPAAATFGELVGGGEGSGNSNDDDDSGRLARELADVYGGDVERVDALVGCHCEPVVPGFGFSETAFRVFIVMASRRLKSDRFIAGQWDEGTYTGEGMRWVQDTTMKDVLGRHFPELTDVLKKSKNVFAPWVKVGESVEYTGVETTVPARK